MNTFNRARLVLAFLSATGLCPSTPAQFTPQLPAVADFSELQQVIDAAWVEPMTSALYPPGLSYTNSIHLVAYVPSGFDPSFLAGLKSNSSVAGVPILSGIVRESSTEPLGRAWYGVGPAALTNTPLPSGYDPVQWVLDTFPPTPGILFGDALDHYIADRRLSRQTLAFSLIATNDVPAYMQELEARRAATPPGIAEQDIGVVQIEYIPALDVVDLLVRAPQEVDYLGVYQTADITPPVTWEPLGTVSHSTDPMPWTFSPAGPRHYLLLANHVLDSDLDGIPDAIEQLISDSDATLADTDGDGLTDYDEVYLYKSNPRATQTNPSAPSDQEYFGLAVTNHPIGNYVSGPINLRFKSWRVERSKTGFPGFTIAGTFFQNYHGRYEQTQRELEWLDWSGGPFDWDVSENTLQDAAAKPPKATKTKVATMSPTVTNRWINALAAPPSYPHMFTSATTTAVTNVKYHADDAARTRPPGDTHTCKSDASLADEYTDGMLNQNAANDLRRIRDIPNAWDHGLVLIRPMPWINSGLLGEWGYEGEDAQEVNAGTQAERLHEAISPHTDLSKMSKLNLQWMNVQATSQTDGIPPGYFLRSVLLEVTRDAVTNQFGKGRVIGVRPWRVTLRAQSNEVDAVSIELKRPPPSNPGTVEIMSGYIDLSVAGADETKEDNPGVLSSRCTNMVVTLSGLTREKLEVGKYRLKLVGKPDGSTAGLRLVGSTAAPSSDIPLFPAPPGPQPATNAYELVEANKIGLYNISLEVSGTNEQALNYTPATVICDQVNTRVDFVHEIPVVMDSKAWTTAAAFMRRWQAGEASTVVNNDEADTTSVTYEDLLLFTNIGNAIQDIRRIPDSWNHLPTPLWGEDTCRGMMWLILQREQLQAGSPFGIISNDGRAMWKWQTARRKGIAMQGLVPSDLTAALGQVTIYVAPYGEVLARDENSASIRVDKLVVFFVDDYKFENDEPNEYLGYWDTCGKQVEINPVEGFFVGEPYLEATSGRINSFREFTGRGKDFRIFTNTHIWAVPAWNTINITKEDLKYIPVSEGGTKEE